MKVLLLIRRKRKWELVSNLAASVPEKEKDTWRNAGAKHHGGAGGLGDKRQREERRKGWMMKCFGFIFEAKAIPCHCDQIL